MVAKAPFYRRTVELAGRVLRAMRDHGALEASAAVAFWLFLSFVPLLVLVGFLVGQVARTRGVDALMEPLLEVIPTTAEDVLRREVERLAGARTAPLAPLGAAGYLWTASSATHNLMNVVAAAARCPKRIWWKQRAVALAWVVLGLATTVPLAWLIVRIDSALRHRAHHTAPHLPAALRHPLLRAAPPVYTPDQQLMGALLLLLAGTVLLAGFYRLAVDRPARIRRRVWPGAASAVVCWLLVSWAFGGYVASIADYAMYYGGLAAMAVLLVWLYLTSLSLIVGAEVNAELETARARR